MGSPFIGILTTEGASKLLSASGTGSTLYVTSWAVSATGGDLDPGRNIANPAWYTGTFTPVATITSNLVKVTLNLPPSSIQLPLADGSPISEMYLFAKVDSGAPFLFAVIHPPDNTPLIYDNIVNYKFILEIHFSASNITSPFVFYYDAGDLESHNESLDAHQKRWVLKAGDSMYGALHLNTERTTLGSVNGTVTLTDLSNSFIINGTESVTVISGWETGQATIVWNTARTLVNSSTLQLIDGNNRPVQIGDIGIYDFSSNKCVEIAYFPKGNYAYKHGNDSINFDVASPVAPSNAVNLDYFKNNKFSYTPYSVNSGATDSNGYAHYITNPIDNSDFTVPSIVSEGGGYSAVADVGNNVYNMFNHESGSFGWGASNANYGLTNVVLHLPYPIMVNNISFNNVTVHTVYDSSYPNMVSSWATNCIISFSSDGGNTFSNEIDNPLDGGGDPATLNNFAIPSVVANAIRFSFTPGSQGSGYNGDYAQTLFGVLINNCTITGEVNASTSVNVEAETPIVLTYSDGSVETISNTQNIGGLSNGNTVFIKEKGNPIIVAHKGIAGEGYVLPSSGMVEGDYFTLVNTEPFKSYRYEGNAWVPLQYVKLGEVTIVEGIMGTPISYAFRGCYRFEDNSALPALNSKITKNHNIGTTHVILTALIRCMTAEAGWAVGQYCGNAALQTINYTNNSLEYHIADRNSMFFLQSYSGCGNPVIQNPSNSNYGASVTLANWSLVWIARRAF